MKQLIRTTFVAAILMISATGASKATPVDLQTARNVAYNFLRSLSQQPIGDLTDITASTPWHEFYTFSLGENEGFILVSADDCVIPILGYSLESGFEAKNMAPNYREWLQDYEDQIAFCREHSSVASTLQTSSPDDKTPVQEAWDQLLMESTDPGPSNVIYGPLLSTTWDQSPYYNNLCPYDYSENARTVTGCVATAMSQVMKYWNHPTTGYGSNSYTHSTYGTLSANFGTTTYNWSNMPNALTSSSSTTQMNAVATLMYHVGVAVNMDYGTGNRGSSASTVSYGSITRSSAENAYVTYFKYSPTLHSVYIEDYSQEAWRLLLQNEINNNRPIHYSGRDTSGGHSFVCDGYNSTNGYFHFNWGWGGYCDGYYAIGSLNPSPGGTGGNSTHSYNLKNCAIIGIRPNSGWSNTSTTVVTTSSDPSSYSSTVGGGSYAFGDTVTVRATANSGKRFAGWADGGLFNPRQFIATGGSISITARFEALGGDTLSYCAGNRWLTSFGSSTSGNDKYWGVKFPASTLTPGRNLHQVHMYATAAGSYSLTVYLGGTSSSNVAYTQGFTVSSSDAESWYVINLFTPVIVDGTQDIYITFHNNDVNYPAALTYNSGNNDAMLWGSSFNSIASNCDYSFMIRCVFGERSGPASAGDTISYCADNTYQNCIGAGGSLYWGISFDSNSLSGRDYLERVLLYVNNTGTYTLNIYSGNDTAPDILLYTRSYTFTDSMVYRPCVLDSPLPIDHTQHLWVTFHNSGIPYPASACNYIGNPNSNWVSTNGTDWSPLHIVAPSLPYSWMIKCVTTSTNSDTASAIPYFEDFEGSISNWNYVNSYVNRWVIGSATNNTTNGSNALYISNDGGNSNSYTITGASSLVKAYHTLHLEARDYIVSFDWKGYGAHLHDYMRAALVPASIDITSSSFTNSWGTGTLLSGYIALDGNNQLNQQSVWTTQTTLVSIPVAGYYNLVFYWQNNNSGGSNPPAAVDNILIDTVDSSPNAINSSFVEDFETSSNDMYWSFINSSPYNRWVIDSATNNTPNGSRALYISNDNGTSNEYYTSISTNGAIAYRTLQLENRQYTISFDWKCNGESGSDFLRVALVPASYSLSTLYYSYNGWFSEFIELDNHYQLVQQSDWTTRTINISVSSPGEYKLIFFWRNDSESGSQPPAAIDNIVIEPRGVIHEGDTISYCGSDPYQNSVGMGNTTTDFYWGIRIPASHLAGYNSIDNVLLYINGNYPGDYTLRIHQGSQTTPQNLLFAQTYTFTSNLNRYKSCVLPNPINIDNTQDLWVTFYNIGISYPAAYSTFGGDTNSDLLSNDGVSWRHAFANHNLPSTWMIKVVVADSIYSDTCNAVSSFPYSMGFETDESISCWNFFNGNNTNQWVIGQATNSSIGGSQALYISNNGGTSNAYTNNAASTVMAYRTFQLDDTDYTVRFDWKAAGETNYDYLRAALIPLSVDFTSNTAWGYGQLPTEYIPLDGNSQLQGHSSWTTQTSTISIPSAGSYNLVFYWHNDNSVGNDPPAAIDNIIMEQAPICITDSIDIFVTACDSYTWHGSTYTSSTNTPSYTSTNAQGCDSVTTLHLTIYYSTSATENVTACDSYTWQGSTYTSSTNTPSYTSTNAQGCDSVTTLHLTINYSTRDTIVDSATGSYTWNGNTYTESGEYLFEGLTEAGCDSVVVLQLTITQLGINIAESDNITLYPNPTSGKLTIVADDVEKVEVFDQSGRIAATFKDTNEIDIHNLPTGAYTLRITLHNGSAVKRVIKQ